MSSLNACCFKTDRFNNQDIFLRSLYPPPLSLSLSLTHTCTRTQTHTYQKHCLTLDSCLCVYHFFPSAWPFQSKTDSSFLSKERQQQQQQVVGGVLLHPRTSNEGLYRICTLWMRVLQRNEVKHTFHLITIERTFKNYSSRIYHGVTPPPTLP